VHCPSSSLQPQSAVSTRLQNHRNRRIEERTERTSMNNWIDPKLHTQNGKNHAWRLPSPLFFFFGEDGCRQRLWFFLTNTTALVVFTGTVTLGFVPGLPRHQTKVRAAGLALRRTRRHTALRGQSPANQGRRPRPSALRSCRPRRWPCPRRRTAANGRRSLRLRLWRERHGRRCCCTIAPAVPDTSHASTFAKDRRSPPPCAYRPPAVEPAFKRPWSPRQNLEPALPRARKRRV
jgi:hypothetical protein